MFLQPIPGVVVAAGYHARPSAPCDVFEDSGVSDCSDAASSPPATPTLTALTPTPGATMTAAPAAAPMPIYAYFWVPMVAPSAGVAVETPPEKAPLAVDGGAGGAGGESTASTIRRRLIKWNLPPPLAPHVSLPGWQPMPYGLEVYWQSAFAWFFLPFTSVGHVWTLTPVQSPPPTTEWTWHCSTYSAKVRFQCQFRHGWTSMWGRIAFWFRIRRGDDDRIYCEAVFKLFGQLCNRCKTSQEFLFPLWYQEEIECAMRHLSQQVALVYYGGPQAPQPRRLRLGCPARHHDPERCQACIEGICVAQQ